MEYRFHPKRCSTTTLAAETVGNIDDLVTEILVRVPARPLVRFRCVSKHWLSLISDPKFCHRHTLENPNTRVSAVFPSTSTKCGFIPIPLDDDHHRGSGSPFNPLNIFQQQNNYHIEVIQSCNGLFLCNLPDARKLSPPYIILNPTTNHFSALSPPATDDAGQRIQALEPANIISVALAFDPSVSPHYKVVCLHRTTDRRRFHIHVYSSKSRSWRLLDSCFLFNVRTLYNDAVFHNGAIHWSGMYCELSYFDVEEERMGIVPPHPLYIERDLDASWGRFMYRNFQESVGKRHLHLIDIYPTRISKFEVLEMGNDYSGWFVKYLVDLDLISVVYPSFKSRWVQFLFLAQDQTEGEECSSLLMHIPGKAFSYNLRSKTAKSFDLAPMPGLDDRHYRVASNNHRYIETLACV